MSGRWLINGLLLLACVLLWLLARWQPAPVPGLAELVGLAPEAVTTIRLVHGDNPPLELEASPPGWTLRAPLRGPVSEAMGERLAALLRAPASRVFELGENTSDNAHEQAAMLADLGLAKPWLELVFNQVHLSAGGAEPIDRRRYLKAGDAVLLIDDRWLLPLLVPPEDYLLDKDPSTRVGDDH